MTKKLLAAMIVICGLFGVRGIHARENVNTSELCLRATEGQIPVGDFSRDFIIPLSPERYTQHYNNDVGHNGIDLGGEFSGAITGEEEIKSILRGIVIVSYNAADASGWGNSILIATRSNAYSREIITHHYHHLHERYFAACEYVSAGDLLGMEGDTGYNIGGAHLHFTTRRWANVEALIASLSQENGVFKTFGGRGYGAKNGTHLTGFLDPEHLLHHTYADCDANDWFHSFAVGMRKQGIDFGLFDGKFGAGENVKRREAARWLKIAARIPTSSSTQNAGRQTFTDVSTEDPDSVYIESLAAYPYGQPIVTQNPEFAPDREITRAEALKMVVMAFYQEPYLTVYNNLIWRTTYDAAVTLLTSYTDLDILAWYAPYVFFAYRQGITDAQLFFRPDDPAKKEEIAKLIMQGHEYKFGSLPNLCENTVCPANHFCRTDSGACEYVPECVPSENYTCPLGGGYDPCVSAYQCAPGLTQTEYCSGTAGITQRTCDAECQWGIWSVCVAADPDPDPTPDPIPETEPDPTPDPIPETEPDPTPDPIPETDPDPTPDPIPETEPDQEPETDPDPTPTPDPTPDPVPCQITYTLSRTRSCYANTNSYGTPTLCLEIAQVSGASFQYRVCKEGGAFQNTYSYFLKDENNLVFFTSESGTAGQTCSPWKTFSVSYIDYGVSSGAGVAAFVTSPADCTEAACRYRTGSITASKSCE